LREAWGVLPKLLIEFSNLHMEFIGMSPPLSIMGHPRVRMRRFYPAGEYPARLASWGWDLTVAPLADNRFNRSKSAIKVLEAAALGIPCVCSPVQPYEEFCALGNGLNWLLAYNESQWYSKLRELISEAAQREALAEEMTATALRWYDIRMLRQNWIHAIQTAMGN
jgi:glycosyltransferase involved in cell wall biosynthesis